MFYEFQLLYTLIMSHLCNTLYDSKKTSHKISCHRIIHKTGKNARQLF